MPIKSVPIGRGLDWLVAGFALFRLNPLIWIVNLVIFIVIATLLSLVPVLGSIASMLLQPVLLGGMLLGCRDLAQGHELRVEHLFAGFRQHTQPLLMVGLLSLAAYVLVGLVVVMVAVSVLGLSALAELAQHPDLVAGDAMLGFLLSGLVGLGVSVPVAMATWFAPALVVFDQMTAWEAIMASFVACLRNMLPFLLYGIVALLLGLLAMIPAGLGLLVLGPVMIASIYTAYRDIFAA